jgi:hypothetical protein
VIFDDVDVPLDEGDFIERQLPGGRTELYEVLDAGFTRGGGGIPDFYHAKTRKTTSRLPLSGSNTHVTVSGPNARVNLHSVDSSTNIVSQTHNDEAVFRELLSALRDSVTSTEQLAQLEQQIQSLQATSGTPAYNKAYADFVQLAANWMTIVGPFLPVLTQRLMVG